MKATLCGFCFWFGMFAASGQGDSPRLLPFQARLTDAIGATVVDGVRVVRFRISESPTEASFRWPGELHRVTVDGGLINVVLGTKTPLAGIDFSRPLYLEVTVDSDGDHVIDGKDLPMLPRQAILPVLFAHEAENSRKLAGHDWSAVFGVNDPSGSLPATKLADRSLPSSKLEQGSITAAEIATNSVTLALLTEQIVERLVPSGTVCAFAGETISIPRGWLLCDGSPASSHQYPRLSAAIRHAWGSGDSGTGGTNDFNLPDFRGLFLRGVNHERNDFLSGSSTMMDPDVHVRTNAWAGGAFGNRVGSYQNDALKFHRHTISRAVHGSRDGPTSIWADDEGLGSQDSDYPGNVINRAGTSIESRPKNAYVNYIIKY